MLVNFLTAKRRPIICTIKESPRLSYVDKLAQAMLLPKLDSFPLLKLLLWTDKTTMLHHFSLTCIRIKPSLHSLVYESRISFKGEVRFDDSSGHWRIQLGSGLDGFKCSTLFSFDNLFTKEIIFNRRKLPRDLTNSNFLIGWCTNFLQSSNTIISNIYK